MEFFFRVFSRPRAALRRDDVAFLWMGLLLLVLWVVVGGW